MLTDYDIISFKKARMAVKAALADQLLTECKILQAEIDFFEAVAPTATLDQYPIWLQELMVIHGYK